jgi:hypothetical protein
MIHTQQNLLPTTTDLCRSTFLWIPDFHHNLVVILQPFFFKARNIHSEIASYEVLPCLDIGG